MVKLLQLFVAAAAVLVLAAGCQTAVNSIRDNPPVTRGDLPNQIGQPDVLQDAFALPVNFNEEVWKQSGHSAPTGTWFFHNGQGKLGYGLSAGTQQIGTPAAVELIAPVSPVTVQRNARIQLMQSDATSNSNEPGQKLFDKTVAVGIVERHEQLASIPLPEAENKIYYLSVEVLNAAGQVEDTMVSLIYVPKQEMNIALSTDQSSYSRSSSAKAVLQVANAGPTVLFFGTPYSIERKVGPVWVIVPLNLAFNDIGLLLPPGQTYEQTVDLGKLGKGEYRLVKQLRAEGTDLTTELAAQFTME